MFGLKYPSLLRFDRDARTDEVVRANLKALYAIERAPTARGGVLDETAMAEALACGQLGAAALDVFEDEPLPAGSPLAGVPNLYLTPHIAGLTEEANARTGELIATRIRNALAPPARLSISAGKFTKFPP